MSRYRAERAGAFEVTREEVESLHYLKNARKAALYLGIPEVQVEDVWAEMVKPRELHGARTVTVDSSGQHAHVKARINSQTASERLRDSILSAMIRWADCNGTTIDEAAGFLMSGKPLRVAA